MWERREMSTNLKSKKPEGKRLFGRPRRKWEDNIKIDLKRYGVSLWNGFHSRRWQAVVNRVMKLRVS
jgi:hypothetical protein